MHRERGFIKEGLLNYLALLGWSIAPDRDVFTMEEMVEAFEVTSINPNPARFDVKKAESINGDHIRLLAPETFLERCVPYLQATSIVSDPVSEGERSTLLEILPFVQERVGLLGEVPDMVAFLFTPDDALVIDEDARKTLGDSSADVLDSALTALDGLSSWDTASLVASLRDALVEGLGVSPRHAFGPLRVALSGRRVSPPLFESMEVLGRDSSMARLRALRQSL